MSKTKVGIVGCGNICDIYFRNLTGRLENVEVKSCADIEMSRAQAKATQYGVEAASVDELMADPEITIVVNLTIPKAHYEVSMMAVHAGKSAYCEKPITLTRDEAASLLNAAKKNGVLVGNAPDTFLGAGHQTCRRLIDSGAIGEPIGATAFMTCPGHESWHPDPEFYYKPGGGPMFDMGPYYLTDLVNLMGPAKSVAGMTAMSHAERIIGSENKKGQKIKVEVPTHVTGLIEFASGAIGTIITSFDVWGAHLPSIEIYGKEGALAVPDPNGFGGTVKLKKGPGDWEDVEIGETYAENARGVGVADMAAAIESGRTPRASGILATHVLDIMHAFHDASDQGAHVALTTTCDKPAAFPIDLKDGQVDS
jgi:predicted dehydrogenase